MLLYKQLNLIQRIVFKLFDQTTDQSQNKHLFLTHWKFMSPTCLKYQRIISFF